MAERAARQGAGGRAGAGNGGRGSRVAVCSSAQRPGGGVREEAEVSSYRAASAERYWQVRGPGSPAIVAGAPPAPRPAPRRPASTQGASRGVRFRTRAAGGAAAQEGLEICIPDDIVFCTVLRTVLRTVLCTVLCLLAASAPKKHGRKAHFGGLGHSSCASGCRPPPAAPSPGAHRPLRQGGTGTDGPQAEIRDLRDLSGERSSPGGQTRDKLSARRNGRNLSPRRTRGSVTEKEREKQSPRRNWRSGHPGGSGEAATQEKREKRPGRRAPPAALHNCCWPRAPRPDRHCRHCPACSVGSCTR